jgi:hypothetical protein
MKTFILMALVFSSLSFATTKTRKVSNSHYFICNLERDYVDKNVFKKDHHFPFPMDEGESHEVRGTMRWNQYSLVFSQKGEVEISISEMIQGEMINTKKSHRLGKNPQFDSFRVVINLKKNEIMIPYIIQCGPE